MASAPKQKKPSINYAALSILVADDFSSFRNTVFGMLQRLGVQKVDSVSTAQATIEMCEYKKFDIILCDYNLGEGKTGQHVLEELRHKALIPPRTVFIMVSAEAARTIVMSAYDCEPDDYLMKPITAGMLQQRIDRMLLGRMVFSSVYKALDEGDRATAIETLIDISLEEGRYSMPAQKWLGELFLEDGQYSKAERVYTKALEIRQLDWARLGLARCKQARGENAVAEEWLEKIVEDNPLFLPAYDVLADNCSDQDNVEAKQKVIQRAVDISPMSILRQKALADTAEENNDLETALLARKKTVKLGDLSCYGTLEDKLSYARTAVVCAEAGLEIPSDTMDDAIAVLDKARQETGDDLLMTAHVDMITASVNLANGNNDAALKSFVKAEQAFELDCEDITAQLDYVNLLISLGQQEKADEHLKRLQEIFAHDQSALEQLDSLLEEPASEANRAMVAAVNREGIDLYNAGEYEDALDCFEKAKILFPKHIGLQLNIIQTLVGKLRDEGGDDQVLEECQQSLNLVESLIDRSHAQYNRYEKLRRMAISVQESA